MAIRFDQNLADEMKRTFLLEEGVYDAKIVECDERETRRGYPMLVVKFEVYDDGGSREITEYIAQSDTPKSQGMFQRKLEKLALATGVVLKNGEALDLDDLCKKPLRVKVKVEEDKTGEYDPRNRVASFLKPDDDNQAAPLSSDDSVVPF